MGNERGREVPQVEGLWEVSASGLVMGEGTRTSRQGTCMAVLIFNASGK